MGVLIIKQIDVEGPGLIENVLIETKTSYKILNLEAFTHFPRVDDFSHIIILGGPMNVYEVERYPFLIWEDLLIKDAIKEGKAVLGICLGAQLIAKALGAKVFKAPVKEIGWFQVELTPLGAEDRLFSCFPKNFPVFQWHGDTFDLPQGAKLMAQSFPVPNQAFRFGKEVYGLQFHLEVTEEMVKEWLETYENEPKDVETISSSKLQILTETKIYIENYTMRSMKFFKNFLTVKG